MLCKGFDHRAEIALTPGIDVVAQAQQSG